MKTHLAISLAVLLGVAGCVLETSRGTACANTVGFDRRIQQRVAAAPRRECHHARSVLAPRKGWPPFILVGGRPIYLVPHGSFSWGEPYASMEGHDVRVTGTLRFAHYPDHTTESLPVGRVHDDFYFEAETAKVELSQR
jgi:hypothetical protein